MAERNACSHLSSFLEPSGYVPAYFLDAAGGGSGSTTKAIPVLSTILLL